MDSRNVSWRKSSYSGNTGCLEAAERDGAVLLRDTKDHGRGPIHRYTAAEWRAFIAGVKRVASDR
jgi:Domain of unknown function (DUF397)